MRIYGIEVELEPPTEGAVITDVMVVAREVIFEGGRPQDTTLISASQNTTGIIQQGMVADMGLHLATGNAE